MRLQNAVPILNWGRCYSKQLLVSDLLAALIVTIMLIPQSLAYAMLAGLPPEAGLYASIVPLTLYAIFGSSKGLSVGPVAVVSLMTAAAVGRIAEPGSIGYLEAAIALAALSGLMLLLMGFLKMGFMANFLSHPVISGFITASGIIIALSQTKHMLGLPVEGHNLVQIGQSLFSQLANTNLATFGISLVALGLLFFSRSRLKLMLLKANLSESTATLVARTGPVWAILATTLLVVIFDLDELGVATLGAIPSGLPSLSLPEFSLELWSELAVSALLISIVGFVESVSVGQTLAARRRESISPNQELIGLGAANLGSAVAGGFPVTGGFSRSVVNVDAGAETQAASIYTAIGITVATLFLTPYLAMLPKATLGATIIVAVLSLVDFSPLKQTWCYAKADFLAICATILTTLAVGVEMGIVAGVLLSIAAFLYRTSQPHYAVVGQVPDTEHFRNVKRHKVLLEDHILSMRIDASLYFANARFLENCIYQEVANRPEVTDVILLCSAVNYIDTSALESLESINQQLTEAGVRLHLSEVKGPVMDKLQRTCFIENLSGQFFMTQYQAVCALAENRNSAPP